MENTKNPVPEMIREYQIGNTCYVVKSRSKEQAQEDAEIAKKLITVLNNGGFLRIPMKQSLTRKPLRLYRKSVPENAALPKWGICLCSLVCSTVQIAEAK